MPILAHFGDQNARATTIVGKELLRLRNNGIELGGRFLRLMIALRNHAGNTLAWHQITVKCRFQCIGNFTKRCANASGINSGSQQVFVMLCGVSQGVQRGGYGGIITGGANAFQRSNLLVTHHHVVDLKYIGFVFVIQFVLVDTNDDTLALVDQRLFAR
ncbi:hypothetical protein KLPMMMO221M1_26420 [Klebsiella pneumoniae]